GSHTMAGDVLKLLEMTEWDGDLAGLSKIGRMDITKLAGLASTAWLTDEHVNPGVDLLRMQLEYGCEAGEVEVVMNWFYELVVQGYHNLDHYSTSSTKNMAWVWKMGCSVASKAMEYVCFIANVGRNHWISVVIDATQRQIQIGDSLYATIPLNVVKALQWWTGYHTGEEFSVVDLPIGRQTDSHSCGVFAWNALATRFLPIAYGRATESTIVAERLRLMRDALRVNLE
ncbi:hypothetical protein FA13DRAFT_1566119, partial [Coprinellus micaceus]